MSTLGIAFTTTVALILGWIISESLRRLYFHPLSHIPGPRLAALTWWYEFYYDVIQPGQYIFHIQELHKKYGPILRITPDELHISDVGFLDTVYTAGAQDKYGYPLRGLRVPGGIGTTPHADVHKLRRQALAPFFSKRNVVHLEPVIASKTQQLVGIFEKHVASKVPVNLSDAFMALTNDIANNFLFAHTTDVLSSEEASAKLRKNTYGLLQGVHMNRQMPFIADFMELLPLALTKPVLPPGLLDLFALFERTRAEITGIMQSKASSRGKPKSMSGPTGKESVYDSVLDSMVLPPHELSILRLEQEGALLVLAGQESPAKALTELFYHLCDNPPVFARLRSEIDAFYASSKKDSVPWTELEQLPYLSTVIEEGIRLGFGVTARTARINILPLVYTPSELVTPAHRVSPASSYTIPAGTPISISNLSAHTAETVFPEPHKFDPERWLGNAGKERRIKFQMAFNKGSRKCLGIELTHCEMYLTTAALVRSFDLELHETGKEHVGFAKDFQVSVPEIDEPGVRVMVKRRAA